MAILGRITGSLPIIGKHLGGEVFGLRSYVKDWMFLRPVRAGIVWGLEKCGVDGMANIGGNIMRVKKDMNFLYKSFKDAPTALTHALYQVEGNREAATKIERAIENSAEFRDPVWGMGYWQKRFSMKDLSGTYTPGRDYDFLP